MLTSYKGLDKQGKWVYGYYSERNGKSYINDVEVQKETVNFELSTNITKRINFIHCYALLID
jgi:hypothetical protein